MSFRSYTTLDEVKRIIGRKSDLSIPTSGIHIGTTTGVDMGTTDANAFINDAEAIIDGMLFNRYSTPFASPVPYEVRWIARHLAAGNILQTTRQYIADSASNFVFDKQMLQYYKAVSKLEALRDGKEMIRGVSIDYIPQSTKDVRDDFVFKVPGSTDVRPAGGL